MMFLRTSLAFLLFGFLNEFECVIAGPTGSPSPSPSPTTKNSRNGSPSAVVETTSKQHRIAETAPSNSHKRDAKTVTTLPRTRQSLSSSTNSQSRPKYLPILIRSKSNQTNTSATAKSSSTAAEMRNSEQNSPPRKQWTTSIKSEEKEKVFGQIRGAVERTKNEKDEWMEETIGDGEGIHQWTRSDVNSSVAGKSISSHSTTSESNK